MVEPRPRFEQFTFIFVIHFFNGHLRPGKFAMDLVIFTGITGTVPEAELREERADQYARLARAGRLDQLSAAAPTLAVRWRGWVIGTAGLTIGVGLFVLIRYAVLR